MIFTQLLADLQTSLGEEVHVLCPTVSVDGVALTTSTLVSYCSQMSQVQ